MFQDWRAAVRSIARRPALTMAVVITLATSIGANSAVFSAIDTVLLKPLPYPGADRLVKVYESSPGQQNPTGLLSLVQLEDWNRTAMAFDGIAGSYIENTTDTTGPQPERVAAIRTSARFFDVLGTPPLLGRVPRADEAGFGRPGVVVLSESLWRRRFNADPAIIGRALTLGNVPRTVVGIMPASFRYPSATTDAWLPVQLPPAVATNRQARFWNGIGRLKPGIAIEQGVQDLSAIQTRLGEQFPKSDSNRRARAVPLKEDEVGGVRRSLWMAFGAVLLVLLAACGNIAVLMLADSARREHDVAMQFALGASRTRIVVQRVREGMVLALLGSGLGLLLAFWGIDALRSLAVDLPRAAELRVDLRLMAFALGVGVSTTLLFAWMPALLSTKPRTTSRVVHGVRGQVGGHRRVQHALVAAQIALAVILLVGSGLLIRSFAQLQTVRLGFDAMNVITFRVSAAWSERFEAVSARQARTIERLKQLPGVTAAAIGTLLPSGPRADTPPSAFSIVGRSRSDEHLASIRNVSAEYFAALGIGVRQGETCRDEPASNTRNILINEALASRFFQGENPLGRSLVVGTGQPREIIGVVGDVRERHVTKTPEATVYYCGLMPFWPDPYYFVRAEHATTIAMVRGALKEIEPERAVYDASMLHTAIAETLSESRLITLLLTVFAGMALLLVTIGLYGILAQFVTDRRREIGLRMALGAQPRQVFGQIARRSALLTTTGLVVGLVGALALTHTMETLIFDISPRDPLTFIVVPGILVIIATVATILPARRAARVDPLVALRYE